MTAHKRRHTTQPFALCKLSYNKFGGIVMRFKDEMKDFLTSVPGKLLLFLFGIEVITLIWLFQWP